MSDLQNFNYDKSFILTSLRVYSSTGKEIDMTTIIITLTIFEDIYNSTISGEFTVTDANDYLSNLPILGFEFVKIELSKPGSKDKLTKTFRIYKVDNITIDYGSQKSQAYTLRFCSEEFLISSGIKISKSYRGKRIDEIVKDITSKYLLTNKLKKQNIQQTKGKNDIIIPYWTPLRSIEWLATRTNVPYVFFENDEGYNFKSIDNLISSTPKREYLFSPQNVSLTKSAGSRANRTDIHTGAEIDTREKNVIKWEFMSYLDVMSATINGMFSSALTTFDPIRLKTTDHILDYNEIFSRAKHLDKNAGSFHNNFLDGTDKSINEKYSALIKFYPTNANHNTDSIISKKQPNINPNNVENWLLQRISKMEELQYFRVKLLVPGDTVISIGDTITFTMPQIYYKETGKSDDHPYFQGKYLITAIRHMITSKSYEMLLEGIKDGVYQAYPKAVANNDKINKLKGS